ncbi:MAG: hypothetical protein EOS23_31580 [Mesorhizobium sp.]|uniref:Transposase n=1 Tax=Mesorhizobium wenxiniae TaxID=2014805 RepID=A0A271K932_9HYPH|nr:hypothetical protein CIT31_27495 [Mesorhizobium wenxiniae]RWD12472.1 MAG: hypothetical protein EOS73_04130 [Mesorhizobium sp.]TGS82125.1 hypothetical protein EN818_28700 [Mesorhizobium sp. M3A.F.Ca.ET.175.01.1.1]TGT22318.1 hypothetical protein EN817_27510 [Mesorhizobium sp. M3A.F.Ca.ET.174.01.1.1]RWD49700.1 MAG: hypothetical protein EOS59_13130 [Mesorhizobium sp.]
MRTTMSKSSDEPFRRVEDITSVQRRRRSSVAEKVRLVEEAMQPGISVSYVARPAGISPSQLFAWKRRMLEGGHAAVQADEDVVGSSRSANWRSGCAISSACRAKRPWKPRFSRKPLTSLAQKNGRRRCCRGAIPRAISNERDCQNLGVSRSNLIERSSKPSKPRGPYRKPEDVALLAELRDHRPAAHLWLSPVRHC